MLIRAALWSVSLIFMAGVLEAMSIDCPGGVCSGPELRSQTPVTGLLFKAFVGD